MAPIFPKPLRFPLRGLGLGSFRTRAMAPSDLPPPIQVSRSAVGWFAACAEGVPPAAVCVPSSPFGQNPMYLPPGASNVAVEKIKKCA
ncbi:MAG: hypothetical protein EBZ05_06730 [Verrucomicrobia bacterium]|nr:hypothetical protein [Verrucomicrobiota bacterium]